MGWDKWSLLGKATGALTSKEKQEKHLLLSICRQIIES